MSQAKLSSKNSAKDAYASKYGATLRPNVVGKLNLFGDGSYASSSTKMSGGTFEHHLSGQFAQPRGVPGCGLPGYYDPVTYTSDRLLDKFGSEVQRFCFKDQEARILMSSEERLRLMAMNPPVAVLACIRLVTSIDETGEHAYGESFLTVLGAPLAAPGGDLLSTTDVWPGLSTLDPLGLPIGDHKFHMLGASVQHTTRGTTSTTIKTTLPSFLPHLVYSLDALPLCDVGFREIVNPLSKSTEAMKFSKATDIPGLDIVSDNYLGQTFEEFSLKHNQPVVRTDGRQQLGSLSHDMLSLILTF